MNKYQLDKEEMDLLTSIESGEWMSVDNLENEISHHQAIAKNTLQILPTPQHLEK